jgi:ABC-2 type transport system permease protein
VVGAVAVSYQLTALGWSPVVVFAAWIFAVFMLLGMIFRAAPNLWTITRRELGAFFLSPIAWIVMAVILFVLGLIFALFLNDASLEATFYSLPLIMTFAIPMLTMRLIADERRSGTIEVLTTAPVTDVQLVLGKFLGAMGFYVVLLLPTGAFVVVLYGYSSVGPDPWMLASGYLGALLMGMFMISFGLFVSSTTRLQVVSAVVSAVALFTMYLFGAFLPMSAPASLADTFWSKAVTAGYHVVGFLAFTRHLETFDRGLVDTREIMFFLSFTAFFLFLSVAMVSWRKWR